MACKLMEACIQSVIEIQLCSGSNLAVARYIFEGSGGFELHLNIYLKRFRKESKKLKWYLSSVSHWMFDCWNFFPLFLSPA